MPNAITARLSDLAPLLARLAAPPSVPEARRLETQSWLSVSSDGPPDALLGLPQLTVRVPKPLANQLRRLGGGNASLGLRRFAATLDRDEWASASDSTREEDEYARRGFL